MFSADLDADGNASNLRQLTDGTFNDFDPCYLPNGRVAFVSERRGGYLRCGRDCPSYTVPYFISALADEEYWRLD